MAIGINDLDDLDDLEVGLQPALLEEEPFVLLTQNVDNNNDDDELLQHLLAAKGIQDSSKIKFEDDNGLIQERDWNTLSNEEKFNILNTSYSESTPTDADMLDDEEINLISEIRKSNLTPTEYILQLQLDSQLTEPVYLIDDLSDDELYLIDLESKVGELSEEDAAQALAVAKQNESLYAKLIEGIRKEYKEREDYKLLLEQLELETLQQEAYLNYSNNIINAIDNFNSIGNLDLNLEDLDKEEIAEFMLTQDDDGANFLYKALQDPETLVKAAWFILNGDDAFNNVSDYFINLIKLVSESQYKKGFEEGSKGIKPSRPNVYIDNSKNNGSRHQYNSINDLDDDD